MANEDFLRPSQTPIEGEISRSLHIIAGGPPTTKGRPFLQVYFVCANSYQRVFRSADNKRYLARCPKCGKEMRFQVGEGGTAQRTFQVSCV